MTLSEKNVEIGRCFGYEAQSHQLIEECAELIQAVNKYRRQSTSTGVSVSESCKSFESIKEEIADVELVLEQIKDLLSISADELEEIKEYKVKRIVKRTGNADLVKQLLV